jgi:hypothetical protein
MQELFGLLSVRQYSLYEGGQVKKNHRAEKFRVLDI